MRLRRTRILALLDDSLLTGLVTLAVLTAAVYISYTATNGLPFSGASHVTVEVDHCAAH